MRPFLDHEAFQNRKEVKALDTTFADAIGVLLLAEAMWDKLKDGNFYAAASLAEVALKVLPREVLSHYVFALLRLPFLGIVVSATTLIYEIGMWFLRNIEARMFNSQLEAYLSWRGWFFEGGTWFYIKEREYEHDVVVRGLINDYLLITTDQGWLTLRQSPTGSPPEHVAWRAPPGGNPRDLFNLGKVLYDLLHKVHTKSEVCWSWYECGEMNGLERDRAWLRRAFKGMNRPPEVSIAGPDSAVSVGQKMTLQASVKDREDDPMVWRWVQTAGPTVELDPWLNVSFTPTEPGTYSFKLEVWDTLLENRPNTATITIKVSGSQEKRPPSAITGQATNVTATSATLNATVNPNGLPTSVYFEWGTSLAYGNRTPTQSIGSGTSNVSVSANLTGLSPNTTYYFRVVARNSAGTTRGLDSSFQTSSLEVRETGLTASPTIVTPREKITVRFWGAPGDAKDWIAIYPVGAPNEQYGEWYYLKGQRSGELIFTAPRIPGKYEFRLFCCWPTGGYKDIARSNPISVRLPQVPQLTASPTIVAPAEKIIVRFQGAPGDPYDWIAIYPVDAPNENYGEWYYLGGQRDGILTFTAPRQPGQYEFRMFCCWREGGYKDIARSNPVTVR